MNWKKIIPLVTLSLWLMVPAQAQTKDLSLQLSLEETKARLEEFNTEHLLDSLDQEDLPQLVSGGILGGCNVSNFIITRNHEPMSSYMRVG